MPKYGDRHPKALPPNYISLLQERLEMHPVVCLPAVLAEGYGLWVSCRCGQRFEYLRDQVDCPVCGRSFHPLISEDEVGSVAYGEIAND